ncbi:MULTISPECIES: hypothetical protein [unclassified Streptomyces]|uniref:hypothetical protein n=1 Tax=unclassified Streptomyces TaxID=2593676 RepID=UPI00382D36D8
MADDTSTPPIEADEYDPERRPPEEQLLPAYLVDRICQALRLAGLPLAVETRDAGVLPGTGRPDAGPIDHVVISWHTTGRCQWKPSMPGESISTVTTPGG